MFVVEKEKFVASSLAVLYEIEKGLVQNSKEVSSQKKRKKKKAKEVSWTVLIAFEEYLAQH